MSSVGRHGGLEVIASDYEAAVYTSNTLRRVRVVWVPVAVIGDIMHIFVSPIV